MSYPSSSQYGQSPGYSGYKYEPAPAYTGRPVDPPRSNSGSASKPIKDETSMNPESKRKLDMEFEAARSALQASQNTLRQQQAELSNEVTRNSNLKTKARSASPDVNALKKNVEMENAQLEQRLRELEIELRTNRLQGQNTHQYLSDGTLEHRYNEAEASNFLQKNQVVELEHLQRMLNIFEEENMRLKTIYSSGQKLSESDALYIKSNIEQVRREIDEILRARAQLNQKYNDLMTVAEKLSRENESLKSHNSRQVDDGQVNELIGQITQRNLQINDLTHEISQLRLKMNSQSLPVGSMTDIQILKREVDKKTQLVRELEGMLSAQAQHQLTLNQNNQILSQQLMELKGQLDRIDTFQIKKEMEDSRSKAKQAEEEVRTLRKELAHAKTAAKEMTPPRADESFIRRLEEENMTLQRIVKDMTATKSAQDAASPMRRTDQGGKGNTQAATMAETTAFSPNRGGTTTVKKRNTEEFDIDELLLRDGGLMGEVSLDEMLKLESRIREFGDCNLELEDLVYKLKAKMNGTEYVPPHNHQCSNYSSGSSDRKFSNKEAERFGKMLHDLRSQIDRLSNVGAAKQYNSFQQTQPGMNDVVYQLEQLMVRNRKTQEAEIQHHVLLRNFTQVSDELMDLKDRHRQLEIKYNTLITVNLQNEAHIEKLLAQIQDNKEYFKRLVGDVETFRLKDRDLSGELSDTIKKNNQLQDVNDELTRRSASV